LKNLSWLAIPLEDQASNWTRCLREAPGEIFSMEEEIQMWLKQGIHLNRTPTGATVRRATCEIEVKVSL